MLNVPSERTLPSGRNSSKSRRGAARPSTAAAAAAASQYRGVAAAGELHRAIGKVSAFKKHSARLDLCFSVI